HETRDRHRHRIDVLALSRIFTGNELGSALGRNDEFGAAWRTHGTLVQLHLVRALFSDDENVLVEALRQRPAHLFLRLADGIGLLALFKIVQKVTHDASYRRQVMDLPPSR